MLAAYRYQRVNDEPPLVTLDVRRFANAPVLAAVAERAVATTLLTSEGRALTEVTMWVRNTAQPFMKVALPEGASIVSVEVAGEPAKPVEGADGNRVPLLRPGFRPSGAYPVSFVYLHNGAAFVKKGDRQMTLPKMDVPIDVLEWELFIPDRFRADHFDGNVIDAGLMRSWRGDYRVAAQQGAAGGRVATLPAPPPPPAAAPLEVPVANQLIGRVLEASGGVLPGVTVAVTNGSFRQTTTTDSSGVFTVYGVPAGQVTVTGQLQGFKDSRQSFRYSGEGRQVALTLSLAGATEEVMVAAESPEVQVSQKAARNEPQVPSQNVQNLQRRASGVLPIRIEVPRAGASYAFIKPLVVDEEALVTFKYKRR